MEQRAVGIGPRIVDLLSALLRLKLRWMILLWPWSVDQGPTTGVTVPNPGS